MRTPFQNWYEALPVYVVYGFLKILPPRWASLSMGHLCKLGRFLPIHQKVVTRIQTAFVEKSELECHAIANGMWKNLGQIIGEFPHVNKLSGVFKSTSQNRIGGFRVDVQGAEHLEELKKNKKKGFFFSGHFANWEIGSIVTQTFGLPLALIYRRPNNPRVDRLLRNTRNSVENLTYLPKGASGVRALLKLLRQGSHVGMLMDQKMNEGLSVPFFNKSVPTATALVDLCLKFEGTLMGVQVIRHGPCAFTIIYHPPLTISPSSDKNTQLYDTLCDLNKQLESWVRMHPEQWFWLHNRG